MMLRYTTDKSCQQKSSYCRCKINNRNENNFTNINNYNEKETRNKTELKESSQKNGNKKRVFIAGDSTLKHVNGYNITKKLDNAKYK